MRVRTGLVLLLCLLACGCGCGGKSTDELIADLKSGKEKEVVIAARTLPRGDAEKVVPALIEALRHDRVRPRFHASHRPRVAMMKGILEFPYHPRERPAVIISQIRTSLGIGDAETCRRMVDATLPGEYFRVTFENRPPYPNSHSYPGCYTCSGITRGENF
jgi:hypothetical protein